MKHPLLALIVASIPLASARADTDLFHAAVDQNICEGTPLGLDHESSITCAHSEYGHYLTDATRGRSYKIRTYRECLHLQREISATPGTAFKITVRDGKVVGFKNLNRPFDTFVAPTNTEFNANAPFNVQPAVYTGAVQFMSCARDLVESRAGGLAGLQATYQLIDETARLPRISAPIFAEQVARCQTLRSSLKTDATIDSRDQYAYIERSLPSSAGREILSSLVRPTVECHKRVINTMLAVGVGVGARAGTADCRGSNGRRWIEIRAGAQVSTGVVGAYGVPNEYESRTMYYDQIFSSARFFNNVQAMGVGSTKDSDHFDLSDPNGLRLNTAGVGIGAGVGREVAFKAIAMPSNDRGLGIRLMTTILKRDHD